MAMAMRMARMATTIISSMSVKPLSFERMREKPEAVENMANPKLSDHDEIRQEQICNLRAIGLFRGAALTANKSVNPIYHAGIDQSACSSAPVPADSWAAVGPDGGAGSLAPPADRRPIY